MGIIAHKRQKSAGDDGATLTLKIMVRVIRSPKQRVPMAPQNGPRSNKTLIKKVFRVATAQEKQGKQGIWLLTFPDRENTGNLVNLIFYTGKIVATQGKF